jgi:hypothetical protein
MEKNYQNIIYERLQELRNKKDWVERQMEKHKLVIWKYIENNWPHVGDYLKAQKELSALELEFKNLTERMRPLQNQYYHRVNLNDNQTPIEVPNDINDPYEIPNGLLGVNRDIFNKLGTHRWVHNNDLPQMYGVSKSVVPWKDHFGFKLKRPHKPKPDDKK